MAPCTDNKKKLTAHETIEDKNGIKKEDNKSNVLAEVVPQNVPSIVDIKKSIPAYCFRSSLSRSLFYVVKDLAIVAILYLSIRLLEAYSSFLALKVIFLPTYWFLQGTIFWAIFVLGHDCGHGSFSNYNLLNDIIGTFLHTIILVPYYPWKISHRHHHKNTGNIDKDEIFYPIREKDYDNDVVFLKPFGLPFGFGASWFAYVFSQGYNPRKVKHLNPLDPLFVNNTLGCITSIISLCVWVFMLSYYLNSYGLWCILSHYLLPVFVFASWLVVVTFLHHHDEHVPWYADHKWDYVRGQLSSVDRDYGWAHGLTHSIGTHQIHHLFSKIPHYHLEEATSHFRSKFPHLVRKAEKSILPAFFDMFDMFNSQRHIKDTTEIHFYKSE